MSEKLNQSLENGGHLSENEIRFSGFINSFYDCSPEFAGSEPHYEILEKMAKTAKTLGQKIAVYIPASQLADFSFPSENLHFPRYAVSQKISNQMFNEIESLDCTYQELEHELKMLDEEYHLGIIEKNLKSTIDSTGKFPEESVYSGITIPTRLHNIERLIRLIKAKLDKLKAIS